MSIFCKRRVTFLYYCFISLFYMQGWYYLYLTVYSIFYKAFVVCKDVLEWHYRPNSLGTHQNWFVPIFINIFNHCNLLVDLRPINSVVSMVSCGSLLPFDPSWPQNLPSPNHFCPDNYYVWNFVGINIS